MVEESWVLRNTLLTVAYSDPYMTNSDPRI